MINKERLYLKLIREKDIPIITRLFKNENAKMLSFQYGDNLNEEAINKRFQQILYDERNRLDFLVYLTKGTLVGYVVLTRIDWITGTAELSTLIDDQYLYIGFGTIVMALVCDLCFEELNLNKVYYKIREDNEFIPSRVDNQILREVPIGDGNIRSYYYGEIIKEDRSLFQIEEPSS